MGPRASPKTAPPKRDGGSISCKNKGSPAIEMKTDSPDKRFPAARWVPVLLILVVVAAYWGALENQFVNWDDHEYVYDNPKIRSLSADHLAAMFTEFRAGNWHPLTWLSHAVDHRWYGLNPWGHHLTNVILHALNTCLVFFLFIQLVHCASATVPFSAARLVSGVFAALFFALHPLRVESVAWVSERKDLLCALFFLLALLFYLAHRRTERPADEHWRYFAALVCFALALMSKPMAVTLPVVLLLLDVWPLNRLQRGEPFRRVLAEKLPFFLLSGVSAVLTVWAQRAGEAVRTFADFSLWERCVNALNSLSFYLEQTLWPARLVPFYPFAKDLSYSRIGVSLAVVLGISVLCAVLWRKGHRLFGIAWMYYLVTLSPVLGIVQVGGQAAADRYTYLPGLSLCFLLGAGVIGLWRWKPEALFKNPVKGGVLAVIAAVLVSLGVLTVKQIPVWENGETLWSAVIDAFPQRAALAHINLGTYYLSEEKLAEAETEFRAVIARHPDFAGAHQNLGLVHVKQERFEDARKAYEVALAIDPDLPDVRIQLGALYTKAGRLGLAEEEFLKVLQADPQSSEAHHQLGVVYFRSNRIADAEAAYRNALQIDPDNLEARNNLGILYYETRKLDLAEVEFKKVIQKDPGNLEARNNLGVLYYDAKRIGEAEEQLKKVLAINPDRADTHFYLGIVYLIQDKSEEASQQLLRSLEEDPKNAEAHHYLGIVYGKRGLLDKAEKEFEAALKVDPNHATAKANLEKIRAIR